MMRGIILLKKRLTTKLIGGGCSLRIMLIIIHTKQASRAAYLLCMPLHVRVIKTKKKKKERPRIPSTAPIFFRLRLLTSGKN